MPSKKTNTAAEPEMVGATMSEYDGVRFLHLDSIWIQGAMRIAKPNQLELEYIQRMMAWLLWRPEEEVTDGHCVQLGLGAAAITRFTHKVLRMQTTAVEINPSVIQACRLWFRLPDDDGKLSVVNQNAARWVLDAANRHTAQVLNVDLYDHDAAEPVLDDEPFYAACRDVLDEGGLMTVNLFGRHASFQRSAARIARVFGLDQVWSLRPTQEGNTVVVAARHVKVPDRETLTARAANIESRFGLPARKWLRMVRPLDPAVLAGPAS
ncbi:MAG TPA: spermidine synthase [Ideonella sp.]|uniref:spermine/spermidine synthase domain-containing protein n=1 Tax=Ideonella sp. TaxID=1929293 RepID=UPI002BCE2FB0|nr:spermidine synthase [Ideonella sp.]HSI50840.1 spermidine synthase [Ideonella sp.]